MKMHIFSCLQTHHLVQSWTIIRDLNKLLDFSALQTYSQTLKKLKNVLTKTALSFIVNKVSN